MNKTIKFGLGVISLTILTVFIPKVSYGMEWQAKNSVNIPQNQIIDGSFYASGQNINIDGTINGDLIVAAQNVSVNGDVTGDIIALGQTVDIRGKVGGNIRVLANHLYINGRVNRNLTTAANDIILDSESEISWDSFIAGNSINAKGKIDGRLYARASYINITGFIGKNTNIKVGNEKQKGTINIGDKAEINGDLVYCCQENINISNQSNIKGEIKEEIVPIKKTNWGLMIKSWIISFLGIIIVGLAIIWADKKKRLSTERLSQKNILYYLLIGVITLSVIPIVSLILTLTIIGIPLAIASSLIWLALIISGQAIGSILIGRIIIQLFNKKLSNNPIIALAIGLLIIKLLILIPYAHFPIIFIATASGIGYVISMIRKYNY